MITPDWEMRFDELMSHTDVTLNFFPLGGDSYDFSSDNCKKFIRTLIAEAEERERDRILTAIRAYQDSNESYEVPQSVLDSLRIISRDI